jgi:glycosyltransferase involved in cell wall biosynthesis
MTLTEQSSTRLTRPESRAPVVLQAVPALNSGGVERGTVEIAGALKAAGWRAVVASSGGTMENELARAGAEHVTMPLERKDPLAILRNAGRLAKLIRSRDVALVHARSRAPAWSALIAARHAKRPFVTTFHGAYRENGLKHWYNMVMAKGDVIIAISDFIADHVRRHFRIDESRLVTIHRGVDTTIFDPTRVSAERMIQLANAWRLEDGKSVVLLPARLTRIKGQALLLEALAMLDASDLTCVLLGAEGSGGAYRREVEGLIARHGLGASVRIVPACRDMPAAYMLADVLVSAAIHPEGFGRTIAEAQSMGRPVIASNHGGAPEIVVEGKTGWLVRPGDAASLAEALAAALALKGAERNLMAARARENVLDKFSLERMCGQTLAVYRRLLDRG